MTQEITKVRKHFYTSGKYCNRWIVDAVDINTSLGYVQPGGTAGTVYGYESKEEAEAAAALYIAKNVPEDLGVETSAGLDKRYTCGECKLQSQCEKTFHSDSETFCNWFKLKSPAEGEKTKETNPKDVIGMKKAPISTLSCAVLFEMGLGMLEGARKYGRHNYRAMGVSASVYYDAAVGHLMDWFEGEDIDEDSGMSHVIKAMTALATLRDSMLMENWIDDRPLRNPNKLYKKSFNPKAKAIIKKYPDAEEPYLETRKDTPRGG